jgi:hypothetical protein
MNIRPHSILGNIGAIYSASDVSSAASDMISSWEEISAYSHIGKEQTQLRQGATTII